MEQVAYVLHWPGGRTHLDLHISSWTRLTDVNARLASVCSLAFQIPAPSILYSVVPTTLSATTETGKATSAIGLERARD